MSGNIRTFFLAAAVVFGSVTVVHAISTSPEPVVDDPPIPMTATKPAELEDTSLAEVIRQLAVVARQQTHEGAR